MIVAGGRSRSCLDGQAGSSLRRWRAEASASGTFALVADSRHCGPQPLRHGARALSRDGSKALGVGEGGVTVWPVSPGVQKPLATFDRANRPLAAVFSPAADLVATGDLDGVVRLWRASTGAPQGESRVSGEPAPVTGVAFSEDGSQLAAARGSQTVVWSVRTGSPVFQRSQEDAVQAIAFASGGGKIAAGDITGVTRVWNLRTGQAVEVRGHEGTITGLAFSPDGASFATASEDETGGIWDARTGTSLAQNRGHRGLVLGAAFAPDGGTVVTGSTDGMIRDLGRRLRPGRGRARDADRRESACVTSASHPAASVS